MTAIAQKHLELFDVVPQNSDEEVHDEAMLVSQLLELTKDLGEGTLLESLTTPSSTLFGQTSRLASALLDSEALPTPAPRARPKRRASARAPLFVSVEAGHSRELMMAVEVGMGGMRCKSVRMHSVGSFLDLKFTLPGADRALQAGAQIVSIGQEGGSHALLGLKFCMLSRPAKMELYRLLDRRRAMWDEREIEARPEPRLPMSRRPFESILLKAEAAMAQSRYARPSMIRVG